MKIVSINLNGIRSAEKKGFFEWAVNQNYDVICMQETRAHLNGLHHNIKFHPKPYHCVYVDAQKKGYSGVGIFSKIKPQHTIQSTPFQIFNEEGRYVQIDFKKLSIISLYLPSGSSGLLRQDIKYECMKYYKTLLQTQSQSDRHYIICGDWNIAHHPVDLKNWRSNQKNSGFLPEERKWLTEIFDELGFVDAFRVLNKEEGQYTWWSNRGRAYENNVGWRIDYQIISPQLVPFIKYVHIYKEKRFSDHAPLIIEYDDQILE